MSSHDQVVLADRPRGYWPLTENTLDYSTWGLNGGGGGGTLTWDQTPIVPGLANSVLLSGSNPWLGLGTPGINLGPGVSFSFEVWLRPTGYVQNSSGNYFANQWAGSQSRPFMLHLGASGDFSINSAGDSNSLQGGLDLGTNSACTVLRPVHAVFTCDGNIGIGYLNGVRSNNAAVWDTSVRTSTNSQIRLGNPPDTFWGNMQGYYSHAAFYDYALGPDRILEHYRSGIGAPQRGRRRLARRTG
jgi:hypothetical protein